MEPEKRPQVTPELRDEARRRLRRTTVRVGVGSTAAVGVLATVAAFTIPGQQVTATAQTASTDGPAAAATSQAHSSAPAQAVQPLQRAAAPLQPSTMQPHAMTGGSR